MNEAGLTTGFSDCRAYGTCSGEMTGLTLVSVRSGLAGGATPDGGGVESWLPIG